MVCSIKTNGLSNNYSPIAVTNGSVIVCQWPLFQGAKYTLSAYAVFQKYYSFELLFIKSIKK